MIDFDKLDRRLLNFSKFVAEVGINVLIVLFNKQMRIIGLKELRIKTNEGRLQFLVGEASEVSVDERITKIETARTSLLDALSAVDQLKQQAEENKQDLEYLTRQIERAEADKAHLSDELATLKGIAALDSESVRKALRLPTRVSIWTERVIAFGFGIAASTIASLVYEYGIKKLL